MNATKKIDNNAPRLFPHIPRTERAAFRLDDLMLENKQLLERICTIWRTKVWLGRSTPVTSSWFAKGAPCGFEGLRCCAIGARGQFLPQRGVEVQLPGAHVGDGSQGGGQRRPPVLHSAGGEVISSAFAAVERRTHSTRTEQPLPSFTPPSTQFNAGLARRYRWCRRATSVRGTSGRQWR